VRGSNSAEADLNALPPLMGINLFRPPTEREEWSKDFEFGFPRPFRNVSMSLNPGNW